MVTKIINFSIVSGRPYPSSGGGGSPGAGTVSRAEPGLRMGGDLVLTGGCTGRSWSSSAALL